MVFKPKSPFIYLHYHIPNKTTNQLHLALATCKSWVKGNISYIVFVKVMITCLNKQMFFLQFSFLCTKGQVDCFRFLGNNKSIFSAGANKKY